MSQLVVFQLFSGRHVFFAKNETPVHCSWCSGRFAFIVFCIDFDGVYRESSHTTHWKN